MIHWSVGSKLWAKLTCQVFVCVILHKKPKSYKANQIHQFDNRNQTSLQFLNFIFKFIFWELVNWQQMFIWKLEILTILDLELDLNFLRLKECCFLYCTWKLFIICVTKYWDLTQKITQLYLKNWVQHILVKSTNTIFTSYFTPFFCFCVDELISPETFHQLLGFNFELLAINFCKLFQSESPTVESWAKTNSSFFWWNLKETTHTSWDYSTTQNVSYHPVARRNSQLKTRVSLLESRLLSHERLKKM